VELHIFAQIAKKVGLYTILKPIFGTLVGIQLLLVAIYLAISKDAFMPGLPRKNFGRGHKLLCRAYKLSSRDQFVGWDENTRLEYLLTF
jgi:hypothetical protein